MDPKESAEQKKADDAVRRQEYLDGSATRVRRDDGVVRAMDAHRTIVKSGGMPEEWKQQGRVGDDQMALGNEIHLAVYARSDAEYDGWTLAILEKREARSEIREQPAMYRNEEMEIAIPDTNLDWQMRAGFGGGNAVTSKQTPVMEMRLEFDELPDEVQEAVRGRMLEGVQRHNERASGADKVPEECAKVHVLPEGVVAGKEPRIAETRGVPVKARRDEKNQYLAAEGLAPNSNEAKRRKAMAKGFVNPRVIVAYRPKLSDLRKQGPETNSGWRGTVSGEAALVIHSRGDANAIAGEMADKPLFGRQLSGFVAAVKQHVADDTQQQAILKNRIGRIALADESSSIPEEVRRAAMLGCTSLAMQANAGLVDILEPGHPRRRGGANDDGRAQVVPRRQVITRSALIEGCKARMEKDGIATVAVENGKAVTKAEKAPNARTFIPEGSWHGCGRTKKVGNPKAENGAEEVTMPSVIVGSRAPAGGQSRQLSTFRL